MPAATKQHASAGRGISLTLLASLSSKTAMRRFVGSAGKECAPRRQRTGPRRLRQLDLDLAALDHLRGPGTALRGRWTRAALGGPPSAPDVCFVALRRRRPGPSPRPSPQPGGLKKVRSSLAPPARMRILRRRQRLPGLGRPSAAPPRRDGSFRAALHHLETTGPRVEWPPSGSSMSNARRERQPKRERGRLNVITRFATPLPCPVAQGRTRSPPPRAAWTTRRAAGE